MTTVLVPSKYERADRDAWLADRRRGIGGSDAPAILGVDRFQSALDVWYDKVEGRQRESVNRVMARGHVLEPIAADIYAENTGRRIMRQPMRWASPKKLPGGCYNGAPFAFCNQDRRVIASDAEPPRLLEIKTVWPSKLSTARVKGLDQSTIVQVQHGLAVTGLEHADAMLFSADSWDWLVVPMERVDGFIREMMKRELAFWVDHVLAKVPPELPAPPETIPVVEGEAEVRSDDIFRRFAQDLQDAQELKKEAEQLHKAAAERMRDCVGKARVSIGPAREGWEAVIHLIPSNGKVSFDQAALEGVQPLDPIDVAAHLVDVEGFSLEQAEAVVKATRLDLDRFRSRGKPFSTLRPYFRPIKEAR